MTETTSIIPSGAPQEGAIGHNNPPSEIEENLFQALCKIGMPEGRARECAQWPEALQGWVNWAQDAVKSAEGNPEAIPDLIVSVRDIVKQAGEIRMEMGSLFREKVSHIDSVFDGPVSALKGQMQEMQRTLSRLTQAKVEAAAKVRQEAQARLAAEARAKEEEAAEAVRRNAPEAEAVQHEAREKRSVSNNALAAPPPVVEETIVGADGSKTFVKSGKVIEAEVIDIALIPRHLMRADITKIKAAGNRGENVPGIKFEYGTTTTTRRSSN